MKRAILLLIAVVAMATGCATTGRATQSAVIRAKDRVAPALVHIRPVKEIFTSGKREEIPVVGSGFIISPDGYVVTNEHVAGDSKFVKCVLYNKEEVEAQVVGVDSYTDIAVLKLDTSSRTLPSVKLGESALLVAGQTVLALGSPHGLARSVSMGIVSVTDRYLEERGDDSMTPYNNWIQTDAAINFGNSGGPMVNLKGEVVGINTRILLGAENIGFAIPIDTAKEVIDKIIKSGHVSRSWIGETLQPMRVKTTDPNQKGVVVADVDPLSPGYEAGLRPGDVLLSIDGHPSDARFEEDLPPVRKLVADIPVGKQAVLHIARGGQEQDITVVTAEKSQLKSNQVEFAEWGFTASDVTEMIARHAQLPSRSGVFVSGSQVGGIAANAHVQNFDIILKVDGAEVSNVAEFQKIYRGLIESKKRLVMLEVKRGAVSRFLLIKQEAEVRDGAPVVAPVMETEGGPGHVK